MPCCIVIAGFPGAFISAFFTGSLLIENIFSLDGLGLLGFTSVLDRDYPVVFADLYIFSLLGLVVGLISDLTYTWIDPRIDFETAGRLMAMTWPTARGIGPKRGLRRGHGFRRSTSGAGRISRPTGAATGRCGSSSSCSSCRSFAEFIANDKPIVASYKGEILFPVLVDYPEEKFGGFLAHDRLSRPGHPGRDQRQWLDDLAADPLLLPHRQQRHPEARAGQAVVDATTKEERCAAIRTGVDDPNCTSATGTGSAPTTRPATWWRALIYGFRISVLFGLMLTIVLVGRSASRPAPCRAISAAGPTFCSSASSKSGRRSRRSICC